MVEGNAGRVVNVTLSGELLLAAAPGLPAKEALGAFLVDARLESVARVSDVIGPVASPWLVAAPKPGVPAHRLVGKDLYLSKPRPRSGRGHDRRARRGGR